MQVACTGHTITLLSEAGVPLLTSVDLLVFDKADPLFQGLAFWPDRETVLPPGASARTVLRDAGREVLWPTVPDHTHVDGGFLRPVPSTTRPIGAKCWFCINNGPSTLKVEGEDGSIVTLTRVAEPGPLMRLRLTDVVGGGPCTGGGGFSTALATSDEGHVVEFQVTRHSASVLDGFGPGTGRTAVQCSVAPTHGNYGVRTAERQVFLWGFNVNGQAGQPFFVHPQGAFANEPQMVAAPTAVPGLSGIDLVDMRCDEYGTVVVSRHGVVLVVGAENKGVRRWNRCTPLSAWLRATISSYVSRSLPGQHIVLGFSMTEAVCLKRR